MPLYLERVLLQIAGRNWYFRLDIYGRRRTWFFNVGLPRNSGQITDNAFAFGALGHGNYHVTLFGGQYRLRFMIIFWPKPSAPPEQSAPSPDTWPSLTNAQASALAARVHFIPPEEIVVACETLKCRDLADGIAEILRTTPGCKVSIIHGGGIGISGVTGIRLNPREPATEALRDAIESTTPLQVTIGPDSRQQLGTQPSLLVVGSKPF
jgi:hypothetical protein